MFQKVINAFFILVCFGCLASGLYGMSLTEREYSFTHTVTANDTVWDIADKNYPKQTYLSFNEFYHACSESVKAQNGGSVNLRPGQVLVIKYKDKL